MHGAKPEKEAIYLARRKGFVRLAIQTGAGTSFPAVQTLNIPFSGRMHSSHQAAVSFIYGHALAHPRQFLSPAFYLLYDAASVLDGHGLVERLTCCSTPGTSAGSTA